MSAEQNPKTGADEARVYQIRLEGHLGRQWQEWFGDVSITQADNDTLLTSPVVDQAALYGLLRKVRDLGMPLVSVQRIMKSEE
jgi:hypothetical protein